MLLPAQEPVRLLRGPYLQKASPDAMTVCWRTDVAEVGRVRFGTAANDLSSVVEETAAAADHQVRLPGLVPATKYFYRVETGPDILAAGTEYFLTTPPPVGTTGPVRFWVLGDCGTGSVYAAAVRDAFGPLHAEKPANFWLMLGDNAYWSGADGEYQAAVFDFYRPYLQQLPLWSCIGNHETYSGAVDGLYAYDRIFDFPVAGECGGIASGTERYFSFNYANIHFISLDSMTSLRSPNGPMANWLRSDLEANTAAWTIAFWHHPPYSRGSHNSDWETELVEMRQNMLPILEANGVDLVLGGHSHCYERSFLIDGHYGLSTTFAPAHVRDGGDGRESGSGAYRKASIGSAAHEGAVYVVAGSSGQATGGTFDHPVMFHSVSQLGSLVVDVSGNRMDVKFLRDTAAPEDPPVFGDYFTIVKGPTAPPAQAENLAVLPVAVDEALLHWRDAAVDESGYTVELSDDGGMTFSPAATLPANATSFTLTGLNAPADYVVRVIARNVIGDTPSAPASFTQPAAPPPVTELQRWRFAHFGSTASAGAAADLADPDFDGQSNLLEYALGTNPTRAISFAGVSAATNAGGRLSITFQRLARPDITYVVEFSGDLAANSWTPALTTSGAANIAGPVTVEDPAVDAPARRFGRVRAILTP